MEAQLARLLSVSSAIAMLLAATSTYLSLR